MVQPLNATPAARRPWRHLVTGLVILLVVAVLISFGVASVLLLVFGGYVFGTILRMLARGLARLTHLSYRPALLCVGLGLILLLAGVGWASAGPVSREASRFARQFPQAITQVRDELEQHAWGRYLLARLGTGFTTAPRAAPTPASGAAPAAIPSDPPPASPVSGDIAASAAAQSGANSTTAPALPATAPAPPATAPAPAPAPAPGAGGGGEIPGPVVVLSSIVSAATGVIIVFFVGLYTALEPDFYVAGIIKLFPARRQQRIGEVLHAIDYSITWWLIGQSITMTVLGVLTGVGLWIIGVPLAVPLAILSMLLNFIPTFGAIIAFIPAALLAAAVEPRKLIYVLALWLLAHLVEGYILTPMVQRRAVWLPPALGIASQVVLGTLLGTPGFVLAYPFTIAVMIVVQMLYVEDHLGHDANVPAEQEQVAEKSA